MTITIYSTPACQPCKATKRKLDMLGIPYVDINVAADPEARDFCLSLGYLETPVVYIDSETQWSGFKPDKLAELAERYSS